MGITTVLETERGEALERVFDPTGMLFDLLPQHEVEGFVYLAGIDWYQNTDFNNRQMKRFLEEWALLATRATTDEERALLAAIERLAHRCRDEGSGTFHIKFYGD